MTTNKAQHLKHKKKCKHHITAKALLELHPMLRGRAKLDDSHS